MSMKTTDRRVNRTRKSLQEAFKSLILEKGFNKVTVQNIIDRANVGRSTFYAHFNSIDDLLISQFDDLRERFNQYMADQSTPGTNPWEITLLMFQQAKHQRALCKALIGERGGDVMLDHINKYFSEFAKKQFGFHSPNRENRITPADVLTHYFVSTFIALLTWWLDHDLPYSAEYMNGMFRELIENGAESMLRQMTPEPS